MNLKSKIQVKYGNEHLLEREQVCMFKTWMLYEWIPSYNKPNDRLFCWIDKQFQKSFEWRTPLLFFAEEKLNKNLAILTSLVS